MSKKTIVNEIIAKLKKLGVTKSGCHNLDIKLSNGNKLSWVGYRQVMIGHKIGSSTFQNKRYPLYSQAIDIDTLTLINSKL